MAKASSNRYHGPIHERASTLGSTLATSGPDAIFEEIDKMLPESWREHISSFPLAAIALAFGAGVFLGMRKSDEVLAAGSAFIGAATSANLSSVMGGNSDR